VRPRRWVAGAVTLPFLLVGCGSWGAEGGPGSHMSEAEATAAASEGLAVEGPDGVQRIELRVDDKLRFSPSVIRAKTGPLVITLADTGITPHQMIMPGVAAIPASEGGKSQEIKMSFGKPGSYTFNCMYHVGTGMAGTIEISE
jgi:plastocyanin